MSIWTWSMPARLCCSTCARRTDFRKRGFVYDSQEQKRVDGGRHKGFVLKCRVAQDDDPPSAKRVRPDVDGASTENDDNDHAQVHHDEDDVSDESSLVRLE